ncbi:MAG TPA: hypothetical protein VJT72_12725 [Pseudonocardiaceae bacterium]|nr:hypothetical protein [Pseudonocardiaceae bacterium]
MRGQDLKQWDDWYEVTICAERPGRLAVLGGAEWHVSYGLDVLAVAHTVVIPSVADVYAEPSPEVIAALRLARSRGARIVSICSGVFALAAAGLRATTHWQYADLLRKRYLRSWWTSVRSTSTTAGFSPALAARPASTCV